MLKTITSLEFLFVFCLVHEKIKKKEKNCWKIKKLGHELRIGPATQNLTPIPFIPTKTEKRERYTTPPRGFHTCPIPLPLIHLSLLSRSPDVKTTTKPPVSPPSSLSLNHLQIATISLPSSSTIFIHQGHASSQRPLQPHLHRLHQNRNEGL